MEIKTINQNQKAFFNSNVPQAIPYRKAALKKLLRTIENKEDEIYKALFEDLKKSKYESLVTEIFIIKKEIKSTLRNLNSWSKTKRIASSLINYPTRDYLIPEPYGCTLQISPWNYPFQLALVSVINAVGAGNTVVLKPSEYAPKTSEIVEEIINESFVPEHVCVVQGDAKVSTELLKLRWDYVFFTGSTSVGKIVAQAAAKHLTPYTLELGGKNPCIIDQTAPLTLTARRIVWGKYVNCGQTCIAPDYLLVHQSIVSELNQALILEIKKAFGENPLQSSSYGKIINQKHLLRLKKMLEGESIIHGGKIDEKELYFEPTLINQPDLNSEIMKDEIFGPLLPILSYENEEELKPIINRYEKPLGFYVFSKRNSFIKKIHSEYSFGGGVSNDTVIQFSNDKLPFGGIGHSGTGAYHGKYGFDTFTHYKPFVKKALWLDLPLRYAPYPKSFDLLKKILGFL
ncbi:MAG: aldehyde dehydrogenase [Flavobacteriaceae bacterium]